MKRRKVAICPTVDDPLWEKMQLIGSFQNTILKKILAKKGKFSHVKFLDLKYGGVIFPLMTTINMLSRYQPLIIKENMEMIDKIIKYSIDLDRECIKSNDDCTNTSQHPDFKWLSFNANKIDSCTVAQTTWINGKMGGDKWTQGQGERAQKCIVPSNLQARITN